MTALLTAEELASYYGVHPETIRIRARAGKIPAHRLDANADWRFDLDEVRAATKPSDDPWAQSPASARARRKR